jgi:serine phosphatase RsbU (regulator of sigma subunit)
METVLGIDFYLSDPSRECYALTIGERYLFGRDGEASFVLTDTLASREHCEIAWNDRRMPVLRDLDSRNGTYLNGRRLEGFSDLTDGDQFQIGGTRFVIHMLPSGSDVAGLLDRDQAEAFNRLETFELSGQDSPTGATFSGMLRERGMAGMLRFFSLTDKTGLLRLDGPGDKRIWFIDGTPRDATCHESEGLEALGRIVSEPGPTFSFHEGERSERADTIEGSEAEVLAAVLPATELADLGIDASDLLQAENVQKHLLARIPELPGYEIGLYYRGLSGVSGDCYDVGMLADGRVLIFLADVCGHGIQAAMVVTNILRTLRLLRGRHHDLVELLVDFNDEIKPDLLVGQFCTLFAGLLDPLSGTVEIALAGHHAGLQFPIDGGVPIRPVGHRGLGIGLATGDTFRRGLHVERIELATGEALLQYTDGVIEVMDEAKEEFGDERLQAAIARQARGSAQALVDAIAEEVIAFADGLEDDLTLLAIHRRQVERGSSARRRAQRPSISLARAAPPAAAIGEAHSSSDTMLQLALSGRSTADDHPAGQRSSVQTRLPRVSERLEPAARPQFDQGAAIHRLQRTVAALLAVVLLLVLVILGLAIVVVIRG